MNETLIQAFTFLFIKSLSLDNTVVLLPKVDKNNYDLPDCAPAYTIRITNKGTTFTKHIV